MKLHCKVVSGYQAGLDKELDRDTILISRSEKADIQLHPTKDVQVGSQRHVEVVRDGDGFIVRCQHANGVTVISGGKTEKLDHGQQARFTGDADLVLGKDGPRIRCIAIDSEVPATVTRMDTMIREQMPMSEVSRGTVQKAEQSSHRILVVGLIAVGLAAVVGIGSFFAFRSAGKKADDTISQLEDEIDDKAEEHELDLEKLNRAMAAGLAEIDTIRETVVEIDAEVRNDFTSVLRERLKSVASVGIMDPDGNFNPLGTAWIVDDQLLATNAHVVEGLHIKYAEYGGSDANLRAIARFAGAQPRDVEIDLSDTKIHPGYNHFSYLQATHIVNSEAGEAGRFTPNGTVSFFSIGGAYDVGLLATVEPAGQPLTLAKENDLRALEQGTEIAYIGYPLEGLTGPRINNPPELHMGRLTSMVNFVSQADSFESSLILTHSLPVVGGASGSPIFSRDGKVIGLISHGSIKMTQTPNGTERIMLGFNYGQRVTMLREIIAEGGIKDAQRLRDEEIQRQFDTLNLLTPEQRAYFRSIFAADNMLANLKTLSQVGNNAVLNREDQQTSFDEWSGEDRTSGYTVPLKPGNYMVSAGGSGLFVFAIVVNGPNGQRREGFETGVVAAQAYYFTVPGNPGDGAVEYSFTLDRFEPTGEDCFAFFTVIPVE